MHDQFKLIHEAIAKGGVAIIILDACRYDVFESVYRGYVDGKLVKAWSRGSCTPEWFLNTFVAWYNVTYISANGFILDRPSRAPGYGEIHAYRKFKRVVPVFLTDWDDRLGTVSPEKVVEKALRNLDGKMIVHFMQPHAPYIGKRWKWNEKEMTRMLRNGELSVEEIREAYTRTLELVLEHVSRLIDMLPHGHIILTSDHGELLGEGGLVDHPPKRDDRELKLVPWLEVR